MQISSSSHPAENIQSPTRSLVDLLGKGYLQAVCSARAALLGCSPAELWPLAIQAVEFYPPSFQQHADQLVSRTGQSVCEPFSQSSPGASTEAFNSASHLEMAPLSALGLTRVGENGTLQLISKSEHYHTSLGHSFPGYQLVLRYGAGDGQSARDGYFRHL